MLAGGNPCSVKRHIRGDYQSRRTPFERQDEEVEKIISHLKNLGIDGDFENFKKMLYGEDFNALDLVTMRVSTYTHNLCSEYNFKNTSDRRKSEIIGILFPFHGENLKIGNKIWVDYIGLTKIGKNVTIGEMPNLAGNMIIGDGTTIGDNFISCNIGHSVNPTFRKILYIDGAPCVICTSSFTKIPTNSKIGDNCIVLGDLENSGSKIVPNNTLVTAKGYRISREIKVKNDELEFEM